MTPPVSNHSINSLAELPATAQSLINFAGIQKIFLFYGDMGAGKTTFIKALCQELGITDEVTSPTFSIVNEYAGTNVRVYHFDFYRLKNQEEALDMGYEEYFYSGDYCLIEWPENIPNLLPSNFISIAISVTDQQTRNFSFKII
ncbi:tRNA (adenosine(37)-N6)-threonylcarbamoyltransferase complex ATPase subunit type 1 TsaE [Mucilaginibacter terrae]|uniref:tRNA (adenosine(37)-N6)-threonylcarbamoyltransferase complex ATPase subunit type 1 TsaE n=1 Tax=Mucilaginibacter terrae TaxID=1955052 RepID=UPI0036383CA0